MVRRDPAPARGRAPPQEVVSRLGPSAVPTSAADPDYGRAMTAISISRHVIGHRPGASRPFPPLARNRHPGLEPAPLAVAARGRVLDWTPPEPLLKFCAGLLLAPLPRVPDAVAVTDLAAVSSADRVPSALPVLGAGSAPARPARPTTWQLASPIGAIPLVLTIRSRGLPGTAAVAEPASSSSTAPPWRCRRDVPDERETWWYELDIGQGAPARTAAVLESLASYLQIRAVRFVVLTPSAPDWRLLLPRARA